MQKYTKDKQLNEANVRAQSGSLQTSFRAKAVIKWSCRNSCILSQQKHEKSQRGVYYQSLFLYFTN